VLLGVLPETVPAQTPAQAPAPAPVQAPAPAAAQAPPAASERIEQLPPVIVIDSTPVPGLGIPVEKYPGNVQSVPPGDIDNRNRLDVSDTLLRGIGSVSINANQGNPWQSDLTYRGFLASPLAGSPIGLSMYLDGMRFNDGFGETINWDLIPQSAIAGIDVIPGSNPIFGLNTLGGALAVHTKRGFDHPGVKLEASGGSFGRWAVNGEWGGSRGPFDWFLTFNVLSEDGWREHSPSDLRQVFAKVGYRTERTDVEVSYAFADNTLIGNGLAPESLLARDRNAVYTFPDETKNLMHLFNLRGSQWLTDNLQLSANGFYRHYRRSTQNGDVEISCVDDETDRGVFTPAGRPLHLGQCQGSSEGLVDQRGRPLDGELEREAEGEFRRTKTDTQDCGVTLQLSHKGKIFGLGNQATVGVAYDGHRTGFTQSEAEADLAPRGNSVRVQPTEDFATAVDVRTDQQNIGVYVTDTLDITEWLSLTVGARYQHVSIKLRDESGENPALDGNHTFDRVSPSAGLTVRPLPGLTLFAAYNEGFRAPTAAELSCADPLAPCNLPNAFIADPPLDPVVARTVEVGARGRLPLGDRLEWSLAFFRTDLTDDILFTQTETTGAGFFQNVAKTRRQGVEAGLRGSAWKRLSYFLSYALVDATYQTSTTLASVTEADGIPVRSGDRIPGIPLHNIKLGAEVAILDNLWIGADVISVTGNYLRGDDGNQQAKVSGYTLLNFHVRWVPIKHLEIWGRVDNATNARYATAGAVNWNAFADPISVQRFVAPGAPIAGWGGVKLRF
jgi:outer membrane receptor protein involved in Fe transport